MNAKFTICKYNIYVMQWWNFKDKTFVLFFSLIVAILVLLTIFIVTASVSASFYNKRKRKIESESNTLRIYIINVKKNLVTFFSRSNLKMKYTMDLSDFYNRFHPNDVEKVKSWIFSICVDNKNAEQYLEADAMLEKSKIPSFSLLKLVKYDASNGLIHIENHILRYITPTNFIAHGRKHALTGVVKRGVMEGIVSKEKSTFGYTFALRFFYIKQKVLTNDKVERFMIMTLKNEVYPFVVNSKTPRQLVELSSSEMVLFDLKMMTEEEAMRLASSMARSLNRTIGLNGFSDSIGFTIGIVKNHEFYQDFDAIIKHAQEACIAAQQNDQEILLYQKTTSPELDFAKYRDNITDLMRSKNLRYLFRPIIDVKKKHIMGYFEYIRAYNSPFSNFIEISRYARIINENKNLLAHVIKSSIPKFNSEKPTVDCRLFFSLSMMEIENILEILPQVLNVHKCKIVLMFEEQEVNENSMQLDLLNDSFKKLHDAGYQLALSSNDKDLLLDPSVYYNFDFFVAGATMIGEIKKNNRIRLSIHTLIEQLLKYHKPIIASDLEGWQSIELIIKSGISIISSEAVAASNDMLLPADKKKMDKLCEMGDKYL